MEKALKKSMNKEPTIGTIKKALKALILYFSVKASMLAMALAVAPKPKPQAPELITATS